MRETAKILYAVYTVMTVILVILLVIGGMPLFDSVCHAFGTAGTGGFSVKTLGIAYYNSPYIEVVLGIFMLLFGVNFNLYYFLLIGQTREILRNDEFRCYLAICGFSTVCITVNILSSYDSVATSLRHAFFQVSSIMTTTGFSTVDFDAWPSFSQHLLLLLMIIGACAGSTGGGIKVSRLVLMVKASAQNIRRLTHPRLTTVVHMDGKPVERAVVSNVRSYFLIYAMIICFSMLLLSLDTMDLTTNLSAELACFNNIGPGLGLVGPLRNYSLYSPFSKMLLSINMLLGRLEIYPMFVLMTPGAWRRG